MSRAVATSSSTQTSTAGETSTSRPVARIGASISSPCSGLKKKGIQPSAISAVCSTAFGPIAPR
jgi:hypothetical protein